MARSMVKNMYYFCRGPKLSSQHPAGQLTTAYNFNFRESKYPLLDSEGKWHIIEKIKQIFNDFIIQYDVQK